MYIVFNLCFDLFLIFTKEVNQIRNNVVCVVAHLVFVFCCALATGLCNVFKIKRNRSFTVRFSRLCFFLVTMFYIQLRYIAIYF